MPKPGAVSILYSHMSQPGRGCCDRHAGNREGSSKARGFVVGFKVLQTKVLVWVTCGGYGQRCEQSPAAARGLSHVGLGGCVSNDVV